MDKAFNKIIEDRIRLWEHESPKKKVSTPKTKPYPVITISREYGARGAAFGAYFGGKIGFKAWNREILQSIADKLGRDEKFLESLDEARRETIEDLVFGFIQNINTSSKFIHTLNQVVKTIEDHGNSIIVGRGSNYICENPDSLHVRIVSPLNKRVADYAARENISQEKALSKIKKTDEERTEFIRFYFNKDINNSYDYDLIINSGTFDFEDMMMIILKAYERKTGFVLQVLN